MTEERQLPPRRIPTARRVPPQRSPVQRPLQQRGAVHPPRNHYIVAVERARNEVLVLDPAVDWATAAAVKWRWGAPSGGARWSGLADVRVRATQAFGTVVLVAAEGGRVAMVRQATKRIVWQAAEPAGERPHAVERIAGGVIVTASGSPGRLRLYADATRTTPFRTVGLIGARGLLYDPPRTCLWAIGEHQLVCYRVTGRGSHTRLSVIDAIDVKDGGQDLQPVYGDADRLWFTDRSAVYRLDIRTMTHHMVDPESAVASYVSQPGGVRVRVRAAAPPSNGAGAVDFLDAQGKPLLRRTRPGAVFSRARLWTPAFH